MNLCIYREPEVGEVYGGAGELTKSPIVWDRFKEFLR